MKEQDEFTWIDKSTFTVKVLEITKEYKNRKKKLLVEVNKEDEQFLKPMNMVIINQGDIPLEYYQIVYIEKIIKVANKIYIKLVHQLKDKDIPYFKVGDLLVVTKPIK